MFDKNLAYVIEKLLKESTDNRFKLKEIEKILRIRKYKHKDLIDTLFALVREKRIKLKARKYSALDDEKFETITGSFDARSLAKNKSYAFVITEKFDIYVSSEDILNAYHNDQVEIQIKYSRNRKKYGIITKIISRKSDIFVGVVQKYGNQIYLTPDNSRIHTNFNINDLNDAKPGEKVVLKILNWGNRELQKLPIGDVTEVLGKAGEPEVEILSVIKQYGLPLVFPEQVLAELKDIPEIIPESEIKNRIDLRDLITFTIDPVSAKDFDDAISLEKQKDKVILYVHIADVAHYIQPGSNLFNEVLNRGNSYYFPKKVIPMLPEKISNKICSLRPFETKLTVTVITEFDNSYNIINQEVVESIIESNARFSYEEIDALFDKQEHEIPSDIAEILLEMRKLSSALIQKRINNGYLQLNIPETEYIFDDTGHIIDLQRSKQTESHILIENFMLIANEYIAGQLSDKPTLYRIHEIPDEEKVMNMKDIVEKYELELTTQINFNLSFQKLLEAMPDNSFHRVFDRMILRSMKKAKYSILNQGHFGLAMDTYTHFTSPIRRLCDLIVHHQIKDRINSRSDKFNKPELKTFAEIASERELIADESEREVDIKNKLNFMKKKLGEEYEGIIVALRKNAIIIEIDRYPVTGVVPIQSLKDDYYEYNEQYMRFFGRKKGNIYKLTDKVKVLVSLISDDIYFQLIK